MQIIVNEENYSENTRLDKFLSDEISEYSRSKLTKLIKSKDILVNDRPVKANYLVNINDKIDINLKKLDILPVLAQNIQLDIIYKDEYLAIINKPVGMIVHPTETIRQDTLVNALLYHFDSLSDLNGEERPGIVHRLDMDTSGLLVVAFNNEVHEKLKNQFQNRTIKKKYVAIVNGNFDKPTMTIEKPIARSMRNRKLMTVDESGRYAKTSLDVISQVEGYSLLDIDLFTGRTHQIRVHLNSINRPILGDPLYNKVKTKFNLNNQLLQAYRLEFIHPITKENMDFEIEYNKQITKYINVLGL